MFKHYIGVIGAGSCSQAVSDLAYSVGKKIAESNSYLVCGGLGGVMQAAARGAKDSGGITIGILPGRVRSDSNEFMDIVIPTGLGEARNTIVVNASDVIVALPGEFGTLSEFAFALKVGKPVINLGRWDLENAAIRADDAEEAVRLALQKINHRIT